MAHLHDTGYKYLFSLADLAGHAVLACGGVAQSGRPAKQEPAEATTQEFALA